jgi:iron(III) transport system ATP-binding protein
MNDRSGRAALDDATLQIDNVSHAYDGVTVVDAFSLSVKSGELVCLLGPSGCGKSTALRLAAGLEPLQHGVIRLHGDVIADGATGQAVPPEQRSVGLVFQDFALFPHLTVAGNVAFGLTALTGDLRRQRVAETLALVGMEAYAESYPYALSGGQQQRVALARALAPQPAVLLLDEPFSGLDARLREQVRDETLRVLKRIGTATLLVTHDPEEALFMADRVYLMERGRVIQTGAPSDIYHRPASEFVAKFFSNINELYGVVQDGAAATPLGPVAAPGLTDGTVAQILIRPEFLRVSPLVGASPQGGAIEGRVEEVRFIGVARLLQVSVPTAGARQLFQVRTGGGFAPEAGDMVGLSMEPGQAFVFKADPPPTILSSRSK